MNPFVSHSILFDFQLDLFSSMHDENFENNLEKDDLSENIGKLCKLF